ncbi:Regulatory protein BlaR1 [Thalassoglobus neptunius]|uniref:Regulatory protein BlaR1 n=1 Tax=Thalassoglobus neptunius TaxID=1938619 RepID=A0A5C5VBJ5_9PLAN|nr:M56 family metallopeptidase [Thalassoglobus neptunius]TWT34985.1 Regulatory protein BlaR1 [Thalassoglobus neptunius]
MNGFLTGLEFTFDLSMVALASAFYASIAACFLLVIVMSLNLLFRRWMSSGQMSLLWGIVLLRLILPFAPGSSLSLQSAYISITQPEEFNAVPEESVEPWQEVEVYHVADSTPHHGIATAYQANPHQSETTWSDILGLVIPFVWLTGFVTTLFWTLLSHYRFTRRVRQVLQCQDFRVLKLWTDVCQQVGLRREIPVVIIDEVQQPAVMGVFRPQLLLPSETLSISDYQLKMVMLHEAAHLKCWDLAVNWVMLLIRAVHWWNPIYWIAATRYVNLREQARDAMVLNWLDTPSEHEYSSLLLMFAKQKNVGHWRVVLPACLLGFVPLFPRKRAVANRLKAIKTARKSQHWLQFGLVSCVVTFIAFAGLTDAKEPDPIDPGIQWLSHKAMSGKIGLVSANDSSPFTLRVYDLTDAILKVAELEQISKSEVSRKVEGLVKQMALFPVRSSPLNSTVGEQPSPKMDIARQGKQTSIILNGPHSLHAQLQHMVKSWSISGLGQITIEARIMTSRKDAAAMAGLEWSSILMTGGDSSFTTQPQPPQIEGNISTISATAVIEESVPFMTQVLSDAAVRKLIQAGQSDAQANIMFAPKVTLINGQQAEVFSQVHRPYVVGIELDDDGNRKPKFNIIAEGISLAMTPTLSEKRQSIQMQAQLGLSEVTDVSTFTYKLKGEDVTVQLPTVRKHKFQVGASIDRDQTLVIACPPTNGRKEFFYLLLTPKIINE